MLVFSQNDQSCQAWKECFEQLGFGYDVASTETGALDSFQKTQHHLIVIDDQCRNIDTKQLCRCFCVFLQIDNTMSVLLLFLIQCKLGNISNLGVNGI